MPTDLHGPKKWGKNVNKLWLYRQFNGSREILAMYAVLKNINNSCN